MTKLFDECPGFSCALPLDCKAIHECAKRASKPKTAEQWIARIHLREFQINNLFELYPGRWRASLRHEEPDKKEDFYEYGEGDSPAEALKNALYNARVMSERSYMIARKKVRRTG